MATPPARPSQNLDHSSTAAGTSTRAPPSPTRSDNPRPSISPLSAKASPVALRDHASRDTLTREEEDGLDAPSGDRDDDDNRSSSLSEPDEDLEADAQQNGVSETLATNEELSAHQSLEVDSEAETERLDQTPHKARKQLEETGRTPSKLNQAAAPDDELSDPPSPLPAGPGATSSTGTTDTIGKKRKRSDTAESSLSSADSALAESPRKRSHSVPDDNAGQEDAVEVEDADGDAAEDMLEAAEPEHPEPPTSPVKGSGKAKRGPKPKGKGKKDAAKDAGIESAETLEPTAEQSAEAAAKAEEEMKHKPAAATAFEELAKQFAAFREKMVSEKLAATNAELELLNQADSKHPEYLRQVACIDARKAKQENEAHAYYRFKLESLRRTTLGERSQIHSQYFQHTRQLREDVMQQLGDDWYKIQNERRQSNQQEDENYIYKFPTKKADQIKQQAKYNQEVSVLSGVAKYVGFPAAPDITGADRDMLEDDLKAMKISRRVHQPASHPRPVYFPNRTGLVQPQSERLAHEQFIEQNAWARPQGPIHSHLTPNIAHTPDWAEPNNGPKHLLNNLSGAPGYTTPMPQRQSLVEHSSAGTVPANSDPAEPPSSALAAPPTLDRRLPDNQPSPLVMNKHKHYGAEFTGFRNISGASTIEAPGSAEKDYRTAGGGPLKEHPESQRTFDTSQLQRQVAEVRRQHEPYGQPLVHAQDGGTSVT
ncbi:hypothetical protein CKM354_000389200 [Cercospora kikuchii]|uniref:Transcriptional regulatory protein DEP1 n=1 Tax=Cercospora kikuchii TaxID=84275 RepID=A0A9P3CLB8_9PEZI|nr:uncharacterized protein CKM354_000389200 [Cercospora kikuchii]GIZ40558.1 hypothetical protein CKM354_000389200 [Cercospora kikuchii]